MNRRVAVVVVSLVHFCLVIETSGQCPFSGGASGICKTLQDCPAVQQQAKEGKRPIRCRAPGVPIGICCPQNSDSTNTGPANTGTTSRGARCRINGDKIGQCKSIEECPSASRDFKRGIRPVRCRQQGGSLGVCCPIGSSPEIPTPPSTTDNVDTVMNPEVCGKPILGVHRIQNHVVKGRKAPPKAWPWMALILRYALQHCGGTLITKSFVLSAAHCFEAENDPVAYRIMMGIIDSNAPTSDPGRIDHDVKAIYNHPEYKGGRLHYYDITLLLLVVPVTITEYVLPACVTTQGYPPASTSAVVTGWGLLSFGGTTARHLQEGRVPVVSFEDCKSRYEKHPQFNREFPQGFNNNFLCAGIGGTDSCQGDSGGPLVHSTGTRWEVVGVVSFGIECGSREFPGVYTRVPTFVSWIHDTMRRAKS